MTGYQDFLRGRLSGLSLTRDGRLMLGAKLDTVFDSGQPEIWSMAEAPDGSLYMGTGHRGRLYKLDTTGKSSLVWTSDQSEIFAVAVDKKGSFTRARRRMASFIGSRMEKRRNIFHPARSISGR